jgi:hypothetical protein
MITRLVRWADNQPYYRVKNWAEALAFNAFALEAYAFVTLLS